MKLLLADRNLARKLGAEGQRTALQRFNIERFARDWYALLTSITSHAETTADQRFELAFESRDEVPGNTWPVHQPVK
jgi:hypothetical protein